jgi:hypothetical protein
MPFFLYKCKALVQSLGEKLFFTSIKKIDLHL